MATRFAPGPFKYNGRVAAALLPSLLVVVTFGGAPAIAVLVVGSMVAYVLDALRQKEATFAALWATLGAVNLTLLLTGAAFPAGRPVPLGILVTIANGATLLLTGVWATLQFRWLQLQYPPVALAFEKLLLAVALPLGCTVQTWGVVAAVGASAAAFYLALLLGLMYYALAMPLPSSYYKSEAGSAIGGSRVSNEMRVQSRMDGAVNALILIVVPLWFYIAVHWATIFSWHHFWGMLILGSAPWCLLAFLEDGLWWLSSKPERRQAMRLIILLPALAALLAGVEGRLVFPAFGEYIRLHPPLNYIAVTAAMYGLALLVFLHIAGLLGESVASTLDGAALMIAAGAGSLAAGVPVTVMPAPLLAAAGLAMYLDTAALRDYLLFVAGAFGTGVWFVYHHFWFLDISVGGLHVRSLCRLLIAALMLAALLPGLIRSSASKNAISTVMLFQAALVFIIESFLYSGEHEDTATAAYPAFLVIVSSGLGIAITARLAVAQRIGIIAAWALHCTYASKLAMLLVAQAGLALPVLTVVQAVTPPFLLAGPLKRRTLEPWRGILHACNVTLAVLLARFAIFDVIQYVLDARPDEGLVTGALLLAIAAGNAPLVLRFFSNTPGPPRLLALVGAAGFLLMLLRPPLPLKGGARCPDLPLALCPRLWDERHIPARDADDAAIYGAGLARRQHWPAWLLVGAGLSALAAVATPGARRKALGPRFGWAAVAGVAAGMYIALEFFPEQLPLQAVVLTGAVAEGALIMLLQLPAAASPAWLPVLAAIWALLFPIALLVQLSLPLPELPPEAVRLFPDSDHAMEGQRLQTERAALLAVYGAEALLLAFALKMKVAAAGRAAEGGRSGRGSSVAGSAGYVGAGYAERAADFLGACLPQPGSSAPLRNLTRLKGSAGPALVSLVQERLGWVPTAGNLAAALAFGLCLALNSNLTGGSDEAIFALVPLLLLLNQDPLLLPGLTDRRRYFPPAAAASAYLLLSAGSQLVADYAGAGDSLLDEHAAEWLYLLRNGACLLATVPGHLLFARYLWSRRRASATEQLLVLPAAIGVLILTDLRTLRVAAGLGIIITAAQFLSMRHVRQQGMKLI